MSTTAHHYKAIKDLEWMCDHMGFTISTGDSYSSMDILSIVPRDDNFPIYTRDVKIMRGTVEELTSFLRGWLKAKEYFSMLKLVDDTKIARKEQDYRNRQLVNLIKDGKIKNED